MKNVQHVFGPVPSRRLGLSLGVSPIPEKTCNYTCTYCQLGRTTHMSNNRKSFYPVQEIIDEVQQTIKNGVKFDVISLVGEGEPTLYKDLGLLIDALKKITKKPIALITNAALFYDSSLREECKKADIVLPSFDGFDEASWKKIDRPYGRLVFSDVIDGLKKFSHEYEGQLWIEIMLVKGENDSEKALVSFKSILDAIRHDRLFINTPVRAPAEDFVQAVEHATVSEFAKKLGGTAIDALVSSGFFSNIEKHEDAVLSIIKRHPMNRFEVESFLKSRNLTMEASNGNSIKSVLLTVEKNPSVTVKEYKGIKTYICN